MLWMIISWIFIGLIVGFVARMLVPGPQPMGIMGTMGLGIAGALIGGLISWLFTGVPQSASADNTWPGWILSIVGSIVLLLVISRRKRLP